MCWKETVIVTKYYVIAQLKAAGGILATKLIILLYVQFQM